LDDYEKLLQDDPMHVQEEKTEEEAPTLNESTQQLLFNETTDAVGDITNTISICSDPELNDYHTMAIVVGALSVIAFALSVCGKMWIQRQRKRMHKEDRRAGPEARLERKTGQSALTRFLENHDSEKKFARISFYEIILTIVCPLIEDLPSIAFNAFLISVRQNLDGPQLTALTISILSIMFRAREICKAFMKFCAALQELSITEEYLMKLADKGDAVAMMDAMTSAGDNSVPCNGVLILGKIVGQMEEVAGHTKPQILLGQPGLVSEMLRVTGTQARLDFCWQEMEGIPVAFYAGAALGLEPQLAKPFVKEALRTTRHHRFSDPPDWQDNFLSGFQHVKIEQGKIIQWLSWEIPSNSDKEIDRSRLKRFLET